MSEQGKVGMYLVADHYHFMLVADLRHAFKCGLAPLYASGIVRVAQNHHLAALQRLLKEGLLPQIQRQGAGIRRFDEQAVEALRVIECLKKSGMEIKDIRQFMPCR